MKKSLILTLAMGLIIFVISCNEEKYFNIDRNTWFVFQLHDTLIYHGCSSNDTFYVGNISNYYSIIDKTNHIEELNIYFHTWNSIADEYIISRSSDGATIRWGNLFSAVTYSLMDKMDYNDNMVVIHDAYEVLADTSDVHESLDVKKVIYCDKFGVIAYELNNGCVFQLDSKLITGK